VDVLHCAFRSTERGRRRWERPLAAICCRVAKAAGPIDDLQRISQPPILTDDAEVSRRQSVITAHGRQFQRTAHDSSDLAPAYTQTPCWPHFDAQLASAM